MYLLYFVTIVQISSVQHILFDIIECFSQIQHGFWRPQMIKEWPWLGATFFSFFGSFYKLTYNNTFLCVQFQCLIQFFTMYINECLDRIGVGEIYNVQGGRVNNVEIFEKGLWIWAPYSYAAKKSCLVYQLMWIFITYVAVVYQACILVIA